MCIFHAGPQGSATFFPWVMGHVMLVEAAHVRRIAVIAEPAPANNRPGVTSATWQNTYF